ncbi:unnamed protein product [Ambrosiozyma monospora]|uniref:Unnamed protein product n=1 Tax=Ambrosiozyma monospora TaxID=43982 RepID=A0ACB5SSS0_AMBMO|nr:unnamed protein product [Ambrosiozyma monospora]
MLSQTSLFMLLSSLAVRAVPLADAAPEADSGLASLYYQCGGTNWTGATQCVDGATCSSQNDYYHQCIPTEYTGNSAANTAAAAAAATTGATTATAEAGSSADSGNTSAKIAIQTTAQTVGHNNVENSTSSTTQQPTSTQAAEQTTSSAETTSQATSSTAPVQETSSTAAAVQATSSTAAGQATSSTASASTASGSSSSSGSSDLQTVSGGFSGTGKTTRYWDCCLPSYSWSGKSSAVSSPVRACDANGDVLTGNSFQSGCNGGEAYMCNDQTPWAVNDNLAYGFGAASVSGATDETLACACFKLSFTSTAIQGKEMVIQITNTGGDLGSNQFDLAMPGGGVGIFTSGCTNEFGSGYSWGEQYGGISAESDCSNLPSDLQKGCDFRFDWFENADNPSVSFEQVVCPTELTELTGCSRSDE